MQNFTLLILMFGAVGVMMVYGSRNKKKQAIKAKELQESIVPGTRVMTTSGLHATVTDVSEDTIELEIAPGVYTTWVRAAVREIVAAADVEETEYDQTEYDESEFDESEYNELSGQVVEPIHDDHPSLDKHPSLEKRSNDVGQAN